MGCKPDLAAAFSVWAFYYVSQRSSSLLGCPLVDQPQTEIWSVLHPGIVALRNERQSGANLLCCEVFAESLELPQSVICPGGFSLADIHGI